MGIILLWEGNVLAAKACWAGDDKFDSQVHNLWTLSPWILTKPSPERELNALRSCNSTFKSILALDKSLRWVKAKESRQNSKQANIEIESHILQAHIHSALLPHVLQKLQIHQKNLNQWADFDMKHSYTDLNCSIILLQVNPWWKGWELSGT